LAGTASDVINIVMQTVVDKAADYGVDKVFKREYE